MILIHSPRPRCQLQRGLRQLKKHSDELQEKVSNLGYDAGVEAYVFIRMHVVLYSCPDNFAYPFPQCLW